MVEDDAPPGVETTAIVPKMASTSWWEQDDASRKVATAVGLFNKGLDEISRFHSLGFFRCSVSSFIRRRLRNIQAAMSHQTKQIHKQAKKQTQNKIDKTGERKHWCLFIHCSHEILIHLKGFPKRSMVPRRLPTMLLTQQQWRSHCSVTLAHTSVGKICLFVLIHIHVIPCLSCLILFDPVCILVPGSQMRGRSLEFSFLVAKLK